MVTRVLTRSSYVKVLHYGLSIFAIYFSNLNFSQISQAFLLPSLGFIKYVSKGLSTNSASSSNVQIQVN